MKKTVCVLVFSCLLTSLFAYSSTLDLAGDGWRLEGKGEGNHGEIALPIRVPCDVQTALFDAGKLLRATY